MATSDLANKVNKFFNFPQLKYIGKAKGGFLSDNFIPVNKNQNFAERWDFKIIKLQPVWKINKLCS